MSALLLPFVLLSLWAAVTDSSSKSDYENCFETKKDKAFPPQVPHKILSDSYVGQFDEIMVIGDVHGCVDELKLLLKNANADNDKVLKILTGDMVRKGPKSLDVIQYVRSNPSIISVRGNNDQNIFKRLSKSKKDLKKSDKFIAELSREDVQWIGQLPYSIKIPALNNSIIVHGAVLPGMPVERMEPFDVMNTRNLVEDSSCPGGYNPKKNIKSKGKKWASLYQGPEHVYFGHDRKRSLQFYPYATGVDTACVYGEYLTGFFIKGPRSGKMVNQNCRHDYFR